MLRRVLLVAVLFTAACGGNPESVVENIEVTRVVESVSEIEVTRLVETVSEVEVTRLVETVAEVTRVVEVVVTATAEPTPAPTETPVVAEETITFTGSGDTVVDVDKWSDPALIEVSGNEASSFFAVRNLDASNERIDSIVSVTEPYTGLRPLDFFDGEHTVRLEIEGVGDWSISILPLASIQSLEVPGIWEGSGDFVFALTGGTPDLANISGNAADSFFAIRAWGSDGRDSLVSETDPYEGTVTMPNGAFIIDVEAVGEWTVEITAR